MRKTLKFLHTMATIGFCGALAALIVLHVSLPDPTELERMRYRLAPGDHGFRDAFEDCRLSPSDFDHRAHVRLAYIYLAENDEESALALVKSALLNFLDHHSIDDAKYHETMTTAWLLAVRHFMEAGGSGAVSAADFIDANPTLLDSKIMLSHYSADLLFSPEARADFVEPDLDPIPRYLGQADHGA